MSITKTLAPGAETRPASLKQRNYLRALVNDRETDIVVPPRMTEARASELIDLALTFPRRERQQDLKEPGYYVADGQLYRVRARQGENTFGVYAEWWRNEPGKRVGWKFVPGAVTDLRHDQVVSDEVAATMMKG